MEKTQLQNYHVHYGPAQGWSRVDLRELWRYKDLIWLFVKRDFNVMYKQTVLGPAWILINPLLSMAMYTVMFGTIANLSTGGVPQPLFYLAGTAVWTFFSSCINKVSGTFTTNSAIFSKVYFPRLAMPISTVISGLINFLVQFALFFILLLVYLAKGEVSPHWGMLLLCVPLVLQVGLLGLGCGIIVSSVTTRYRDLMVVVTFGVQLWMYGTPVVYPLRRRDDRRAAPYLQSAAARGDDRQPHDRPDGEFPRGLLQLRRGIGADVGRLAGMDGAAAGRRHFALRQGRKDLCRYGLTGGTAWKIRN